MADPLVALRDAHPSAGWWVFAWGGLFDSRWVETPPLAHIVNVGLGPTTACGRERFAQGAPGGSWGPSLDRLGGLQPRSDEPRIAPCPDCLAAIHQQARDIYPHPGLREDALIDALAALPESVRVAARKPE